MLLKPCPVCRKEIPLQITVCPYCHKNEKGQEVSGFADSPTAALNLPIENDLKQLESDDPVIREQGVEQLCQRGTAVVPSLIAVMNEHARRGLPEIARVLGRLRDRRAFSALLQAIKMGDESLRAASVWAVCQFRDLQMLPEITMQADRFDPTVQAYVAYVLGTFRDPQTAGALAKLARHPSTEVAFQAAWALGETGVPEAVAPLRRLLTRKDPVVQSAAAVSLRRLGAPVRRVFPAIVYGVGFVVSLCVAAILAWYAYK